MSSENIYEYNSNKFGACGLVFELDDVFMKIKTIVNKNNCGFGYNVSADGSYKLLDNYVPEYYTNGEGSKNLF